MDNVSEGVAGAPRRSGFLSTSLQTCAEEIVRPPEGGSETIAGNADRGYAGEGPTVIASPKACAIRVFGVF